MVSSTLLAERRELSIYARDMSLAHQAAVRGSHLEAERILKRWAPAKSGAGRRSAWLRMVLFVETLPRSGHPTDDCLPPAGLQRVGR